MMNLNKNLSTQALKEDFRVHNKISMKKNRKDLSLSICALIQVLGQ
jgi:hypothetical protein